MTPEELQQTLQQLSASANDTANVLRHLKPNSPLSSAINLELNTLRTSGKSEINCQIYKLLASACSSKQTANYLPAVIQFVPGIIWNYLVSVALQSTEQSYITPCLLKIYNDAVLDHKGEPSCKLFKMPSVSHPSIYNQSTIDKVTALTQSALRKHDRNHAAVASAGPYSIYDQLNASNRNSIIYVIISIYNEIISELPEYSHTSFCQMCSRIANCGFENDCDRNRYHLSRKDGDNGAALDKLPRICLNSAVINNMVAGLLYIMHNGHEEIAKRALKCVHYRASMDLMIDTLLVTNAALHVLNESVSLEPTQSSDISHNPETALRKLTPIKDKASDGTGSATKKSGNLSTSAAFSKSLDLLNADKTYPIKAKSVEELRVTRQSFPVTKEEKVTRRDKHAAVSVDNINLTLSNTKGMFQFQQEKSKSVPAVSYSEEVEV
ncbi:Hyccin [Trichoplax sp. H2]|nr:Hyccin [Trichoplax sp. H2]|eukprot:RDD40665.1 Hyccin [Trichoplax sp. H2]